MNSNYKEDLEKASQSLEKNIKSLRKENGLTQKQFAELLNVSLYSIKKIEKGDIPKRLSIEILINIYYNFGTTPSQMLNL